MERASDIEVFGITYLGDNVVDYVPIFGSGMHLSCFAVTELLMECVGDSKIEFMAERKKV